MRKDQRGSIVVMSTMIIVLALVFVAFLIDLGRAWVLRARLQAATDAAALAATQKTSVRVIAVTRLVGDDEETTYELEIDLDPEAARSEAQNVLRRNMQAWRAKEPHGDTPSPEIVWDRVSTQGTSVKYEVATRTQIPSILIGPVSAFFGGSAAPRYLNVRLVSESTMRVRLNL